MRANFLGRVGFQRFEDFRVEFSVRIVKPYERGNFEGVFRISRLPMPGLAIQRLQVLAEELDSAYARWETLDKASRGEGRLP